MNQLQDIIDHSQSFNKDVTAFLPCAAPPPISSSHDLVCTDSLFTAQTIHTEWNKTLFFLNSTHKRDAEKALAISDRKAEQLCFMNDSTIKAKII